MLVLSRKPGESVVIGGNITVTVVETSGNRVRLAFDAPKDVRILRVELVAEQDRLVDNHERADLDLERKPAEWKVANEPQVGKASLIEVTGRSVHQKALT